MKIIIATDGSDYSQTALKQCLNLITTPGNTEVRIVSAVDLLSFVPAGFLPPDANLNCEEINRAAHKKAPLIVAEAAAEFRRHFSNTCLKVTTKVVVAAPKRAIIEEAENWQADLVVVGSHGYGFWERTLLGQVSTAVAQHAPCSVLVARKHDLKIGIDEDFAGKQQPTQPNVEPQAADRESQKLRILIATDGSEFSRAAIENCCLMFEKSENTIFRIVSAAEVATPVSAEFFEVSAQFIQNIIDAARKQAEERIKIAETQIQNRFPGLMIDLTTTVKTGSPEQMIVAEAAEWAADLIVLGSHGRGFWERMLIGSVSQAVVEHAACSVLVVRKPVSDK